MVMVAVYYAKTMQFWVIQSLVTSLGPNFTSNNTLPVTLPTSSMSYLVVDLVANMLVKLLQLSALVSTTRNHLFANKTCLDHMGCILTSLTIKALMTFVSRVLKSCPRLQTLWKESRSGCGILKATA